MSGHYAAATRLSGGGMYGSEIRFYYLDGGQGRVLVNVGAHGQMPGLGMHWEMWALSEGGMSNHRVLRAATLNGARTLGLEKQIGTLEVGKLADLLVLDANPLENIRNTNTVRYTMVNGRLYDAFSMNEVGNYDRPCSKCFWELADYKSIDWNEAWGGPGVHGNRAPRAIDRPGLRTRHSPSLSQNYYRQ